MTSSNGYREFLNRKTGRRIRVGYVESLAICLNIVCRTFPLGSAAGVMRHFLQHRLVSFFVDADDNYLAQAAVRATASIEFSRSVV